MSNSEPDPGNLKPIPETADAIAVAIQQEDGPKSVPKVVAGGRGRVAEQILQIAFAQGIKVREDADLAQLLASIDDESEIPLDAFAAVAEILTYVYQANNDMPAAEDAPGDAAEEDAPDMPSAADLVALWSKENET